MTFTPDEPSIADEFPGPDEIREFEVADRDDNVYISVAKGWKLVVTHDGELKVEKADKLKKKDDVHMIRSWVDDTKQTTKFRLYCVETLVAEKEFDRETTEGFMKSWVDRTIDIHKTICEHV